MIEKIIGIKNTTDLVQDTLYYVKWNGFSYIHCSLLKKEQIILISGGKSALENFQARDKQTFEPVPSSFPIPNLFIPGDNRILLDYFQVDRIIGKRIYHYNDDHHFNQLPNLEDYTNIPPFLYSPQINHQNDTKIQYYVKWCSEDYDQCSWEFPDAIPDQNSIQNYELRHNDQQFLNSAKIDHNKTKVDRDSFQILNEQPYMNGNVLRGYQIEGFNFLCHHWFVKRNTILADEKGLGKKVQIIAALLDISVNHGIRGPFIIICQPSSVNGWENEFKKWSNLYSVVYRGSDESLSIIRRYEIFESISPEEVGSSETEDLSRVRFDVMITDFPTYMDNVGFFELIEWHYVVLADFQSVKKIGRNCYDSLLKLKFEHCALLSDKLEDKPIDFFPLLHFIDRENFGDEKKFLKEWCDDDDDDVESLLKFRTCIVPYILRRKKFDILMNDK